MANNLVKWWKTKFLNGYKQFSVECGDGKVSDTEELLGRLGSEVDACTTPPIQPQDVSAPSTPTEDTSPKKTPQHQLNFEEFSCDVSMEDGESKPGQERQEFSFTLYDFDGHGKITKDDISGLVTTIYEALGSSVKVPHYGSKTIKVKLTVSPDQRKHVSATIINQKDNQDEKPHESIQYKRDLNVTIRQGVHEKQRHCRRQSKQKTPTKKHHCCNRHEEEQEQEHFVSDDSSDAYSRISDNLTSDEEEGECSDNERTKLKKHQKKCQRSSSPRYTIPNLFVKDTICTENSCPKRTPKKRSGSLQRQELLEIIQANMDKNNLGFQTPRKHSNHVSTQTRQEPHKHHAKNPKMAASPLQYLANIVDPTHFYVDLASLQNTTQLPQTHCEYDKLIDAVMCVSNKKMSLNKPKCRKHRAKNDLPDIPFRYQFLQYPLTNDENKLKAKRTPKKSASEVKSKNPHVVTGHTSSPHHLRHRNRQEDQARAMAQVVRWLEQEFSSNLNMKDKAKSNHFAHSTYKEKSNSSASAPNEGVERHEHHHVHEHIHHHYHHYQEPPLVV
ncbi:hypothetical protein Zmor_003451 [Zophobas morio]|uniref:Protein naked cuticle homolog n=2 Tax=Zophobas morio TaxID=2755281 RepID=A0AA38HM46_9CUCU|nr:hypothetical protein Zmor_003451 [Zophobas morio]